MNRGFFSRISHLSLTLSPWIYRRRCKLNESRWQGRQTTVQGPNPSVNFSVDMARRRRDDVSAIAAKVQSVDSVDRRRYRQAAFDMSIAELPTAAGFCERCL